MRRLPETHLTLYSELLDQLIPAAAEAVMTGSIGGTFVAKEVKGNRYWYLQRSEGSTARQVYLGADRPELRRWMERARTTGESIETERRNLQRIARMLATGGAVTEPAAVLKVLRLLADSRVFHLGGVLVGTLAYRTYANLLGVVFSSGTMPTQDIDIAQDAALGVALARSSARVELQELIKRSGLDLHPVPPFDPKHASTSHKVRGRDLRVDFLTPMVGREPEDPVYLPAFGLSAQRVRHLEYLITRPTQAAVLGTDVVLVNVPEPERFALHKLWTASKRPTAFQAKARKDVAQAEELLRVATEDRPDQLLEAWQDLPSSRVRETIVRRMRNLAPEVRTRLAEVLGARLGA